MNRSFARRGITLIEVTTVSGLMAFLALLLSSAWIGMGRPTVDVIVRGGLFQEIDTAVAALAQDLGGSMAGPDARLGGKTKYRWVGWMMPAAGELWLCYDGGAEPDGDANWSGDDTVIKYMADGDSLVRYNQNTGTTFTVARKLESITVTDVDSEFISIALTFQHREITRSCTLLVRKPVN
ncbi:MAG: hypothetical protein JW959_05310 [Pirellulales bacterium]|nr:hypothetical protein [Pirellulales bacterium]